MILEVHTDGKHKQYFDMPPEAQARLDSGAVVYFQFSEILHTFLILSGGKWINIKEQECK